MPQIVASHCDPTLPRLAWTTWTGQRGDKFYVVITVGPYGVSDVVVDHVFGWAL